MKRLAKYFSIASILVVLLGAGALFADPIVSAAMLAGNGITITVSNGIATISVANPVSSPATVPQGGTGAASFTAHGQIIGEGTGTFGVSTAGSTGDLFQSAGASTDGSYSHSLSGPYNFTNALVAYGNAAGVPTHIATQQLTPPALTSCGGGTPAIVGTDEAGIVTMGTSATGCVITFNVAYTATPFCVVSWIATPLASQSYVTAAATITTTQTSTSSNKLQYVCRAQAGG